MLFIISAVGLVGAVVLGVVGLARGDAGELEQILAIACVAMAAAGIVGRQASVGTDHPPRERHHVGVTLGDLFSAIVIAPWAAVCFGVFLLTLVPSIYVCLPVLAIWWLGSDERRERHDEPTAAPPPLQQPATA